MGIPLGSGDRWGNVGPETPPKWVLPSPNMCLLGGEGKKLWSRTTGCRRPNWGLHPRPMSHTGLFITYAPPHSNRGLTPPGSGPCPQQAPRRAPRHPPEERGRPLPRPAGAGRPPPGRPDVPQIPPGRSGGVCGHSAGPGVATQKTRGVGGSLSSGPSRSTSAKGVSICPFWTGWVELLGGGQATVDLVK